MDDLITALHKLGEDNDRVAAGNVNEDNDDEDNANAVGGNVVLEKLVVVVVVVDVGVDEEVLLLPDIEYTGEDD